MDGFAMPARLAAVTPLAAELGDLKRVRDASSPDSLANRLFRRAWSALMAGAAAHEVARAVTADAIAATRLGGIHAPLLARLGLSPEAAAGILGRAFDEAIGGTGMTSLALLRPALGLALPAATPPAFVEALIHQPRAGATSPGKPRIILEPPESHGDHCLVVAVLGVVLAEPFGAEIGAVFLAGLAHHLHNATLPDSGFAGEILLGEHLGPLMRALFDTEIATLPATLAEPVRTALAGIGDADRPLGRAFNAADVMDRVLQMRHYARVSAFTIDQALEDLDLVHAGPLQAFHKDVLREAGLP